MSRPGSPAACERARAWVSEALDDELPELRRVALGVHLRACPACAAFAREAGALTAELRAAPLLQPSVRFGAAPAPRGRRRTARLALASALVVAASTVLGAVLGRSSQPQSAGLTVATNQIGFAA